MTVSAESLYRFEIPGVVKIARSSQGLARLEITTSLAQAQLYLQGAHLTHFQPTGCSPVLFTSERTFLQPGKAIRGGVPLCFPWFGPHGQHAELPMHGFARTSGEWELESVEKWPDERVAVVLRLVVSDATRAVWPQDFVARYRVTIGRQLEMALEVENWSEAPFTYEEALHTYLAVRDVRQVGITGLAGAEYLDKTDAFARKREGEAPIRITGENDRVYLNTETLCSVNDAAGARHLRVRKEGSRTTVVWNPWTEKAAKLADMSPDEWPQFVCIETANAAENAVTLAPGATHTIRAVVEVENDAS